MTTTINSQPPRADGPRPRAAILRRPPIRLTTEFDSDSSLFLHKLSCKVFDALAKIKFSFQNNQNGEISDPHVSLVSKYLSLSYDVAEKAAFVKSSVVARPGLVFKAFHDVKKNENGEILVPQLSLSSKYLSLIYDVGEGAALVKSSVDVWPGLTFKAFHNVKENQGELSMVTDLAGPAYKLELSTDVPTFGLPKATFKFPCGQVSVEEKDEEEAKPMLSINGLVKGHLLNGRCSAEYSDENLNLQYLYKDEKLTFIPRISLPLNIVSFAFKRRFSPSDKLSYLYNFYSNDWSTVYKHTVGRDYKLKIGYDSNVRLGWASLWVGDELGKAKSAPMKTKIQFMLQVPQDNIASSALMFRVKKRWDI